MKPYTRSKADVWAWSLFCVTIQLEDCTSWSRTTTLQHGHALLAQLLHHSSPERSKVQNHTRSRKGARLSALERRWKKIQETAMARSSTAFLAAFRSLGFQDAAPGKAAHESLMNSILFNTSNRAIALSSCIAQAKCHNPRGSRDSIARGRLPGSRGAHDLRSRVHHPTSYSVTETRGGCCNTDEHWAFFSTCPPCCKAVLRGLANIGKPTTFCVSTYNPWLFFPPFFYLFHFYMHWKGSQSAILYHFASAFSCSTALVPLPPSHKGTFSRKKNSACITENTQNPYAEMVL